MRALESLFSLPLSEKPFDVVVVDNASSDDTVKLIRSSCNPLTIKINSHNRGLSKANNIGATLARGNSLFFLNPDIEILPGAVSVLFKFQNEHPLAGIIGPAMVDGNGIQQSTARTWPTPSVIASRRTGFGTTEKGKKISHDHLNRFNSTDVPVKADWLVGAAMWLTPSGQKEIGLMSEKYFLYFEDVEWCWRTWRKGMQVWFEPEAKIKHVCQRESTSGGLTLSLHLRSMIRFMITHPQVLFGSGPGTRN